MYCFVLTPAPHTPIDDDIHVLICCSKLGGGDFRLIYRHYATLYFVVCVDSSESELGILDLIQVTHILVVTVMHIIMLVVIHGCYGNIYYVVSCLGDKH